MQVGFASRRWVYAKEMITSSSRPWTIYQNQFCKAFDVWLTSSNIILSLKRKCEQLKTKGGASSEWLPWTGLSIKLTLNVQVGGSDDAVDLAGVLAHVARLGIADDQLVHVALLLNQKLVLLALEYFLSKSS